MIITEIPKKLVGILVLQIGGCVYAILATAAMAKVRRIWDPSLILPIDAELPWIKSFGWLLFLLPCAWYFMHVRQWWKRGADMMLLGSVVLSGVASFGIILVAGLLWSSKALGVGRIIQAAG